MSENTTDRVIEFVTKYAWVVRIAIAFVLFVPKEAADQIGVSDVRSKNLGYLWIGLVVTGHALDGLSIPISGRES